jgi:large subunit ribosomal protein L25
MEEKVIKASIRTEKGKNANRRLRSEGIIPGVLYSHGTSELLQIESKDFFNLFHGHISESVIFSLDIKGHDDGEQLAFVKDYDKDPVTGEIIHLDFFKVTRGEKIQTIVPVELTGTPAGVRIGGQLDIGDREIDIECLPKDLPEKIVVDIAELNIGDVVHTGDISLPEGIKLMSPSDNIIASVQATRAAEEEEELDEAVVAEETVESVE